MAKHTLAKPDTSGWKPGTKLGYRILEAMRWQELPAKPKTGQGYEVWPEGNITAEGISTYGMIRLGTENKLMISFCGGGVSVSEYTAARPGKIGQTGENYYAVEPIPADVLLRLGTNGRSKKNPFRNWSILFLPYTTGDFHCGRNEYPYTDRSGRPAVLHHHGYANTQNLIRRIKEYVPRPEKLIITGFSAGAFGTSLLADDVIAQFPDCHDVTVICDSAMMENDWQPIARTVWNAPEEICAKLTGKEIVSDSLIALHRKRPEVKIMFCCSKRDFALSQWIGFIEDNGSWNLKKEYGDRFQSHLKDMVTRLMREIPKVGIFIFNTPDRRYENEQLTTHCICGSGAAFRVAEEGVTVAQWMEKGVNGELLQLGVENLK